MAQSANAAAGGDSFRFGLLRISLLSRIFCDHRFSRCFGQAGRLARAAARLGEAGINIDYGYGGVAPGTNATFLIFGVAEMGEAVNIFDQAAAANATI
jgi:hypothetical protein